MVTSYVDIDIGFNQRATWERKHPIGNVRDVSREVRFSWPFRTIICDVIIIRSSVCHHTRDGRVLASAAQ